MIPGRPRTIIGTYGLVGYSRTSQGYRAITRYRDVDGRLRAVTASGPTQNAARARLKERLLDRSGYGAQGELSVASSFIELTTLWLEDLDTQKLSDGTKDNYRDDIKRHVAPAFNSFTLGEITTGRVERFLRSETAVSYSRAKHSRTMLNLLFGFALRYDAFARNPVEGTSPLRKPKGSPQALALEQIAAIRHAASIWRTGDNVLGPIPDGQVRDLLEVLLGIALRIGEALALRACDVEVGRRGIVVSVRGTVVLRTREGAVRQDHPKTEHSVRRIAVPEFAAEVLDSRLAGMTQEDRERTIFQSREG